MPSTFVAPVRLEEWNRMNSTFKPSAATMSKTDRKPPARFPSVLLAPGSRQDSSRFGASLRPRPRFQLRRIFFWRPLAILISDRLCAAGSALTRTPLAEQLRRRRRILPHHWHSSRFILFRGSRRRRLGCRPRQCAVHAKPRRHLVRGDRAAQTGRYAQRRPRQPRRSAIATRGRLPRDRRALGCRHPPTERNHRQRFSQIALDSLRRRLGTAPDRLH